MAVLPGIFLCQESKFLYAGYFIGSGVVEAGCKSVIGKRLKQSGMFCSEQGADKISSPSAPPYTATALTPSGDAILPQNYTTQRNSEKVLSCTRAGTLTLISRIQKSSMQHDTFLFVFELMEAISYANSGA